jgi:arginine exporter protein ArgO
MKNTTKSKIDGIIFILLGLHMAWLWFFSFCFVVVAVVDTSTGTTKVNGSTVSEGIRDWIGLPEYIHSIGFIISIAFLISWGIFTLKRKSNQQVDPTVKTPVESGNEQGTAGHP